MSNISAIILRVFIIVAMVIAYCPAVGFAEEPPLIILVPNDVLADYEEFIDSRDVLSLTEYDGESSRRDVVEVVLLQQALHLGGVDQRIKFSEVDSYKRILVEMRGGRAVMAATSSWLIDLQEIEGEVYLSNAIIEDGEFEAGLYTLPNNTTALSAKTLLDVRELSAVSSKAWKIDWATLRSMNLRRLENTVTWLSMVRMVNAGRIDFLLAPFQVTDDLSLTVESVRLVPIPGIKIGLKGSRHFAVSKSYPGANEIFEALNKGLSILERRGAIKKAYLQSGFFNHKVASWVNISLLE